MLSTKQELNGSPNLVDAFQVYKLPLDISQDYIDPVDGHVHRYQTKCLGKCLLKFGNQVYPQVTFFEITESEINNKEEETIIETTTTTEVLPPKKRKRRRMIRYDIIFTVDKGLITLSSDHVFFILSRDAVTECLTHVAPHKLLISFFTPSSCTCPPTMEESNAYKTKLEEFAAVCITSCKLQPQLDHSSSSHVNNMILSSVPHELYVAIKQMVSSYELLCQNMTELMKLHKEKVVHHKAEMDFLPETAISLPNQSDDEFHASSKHHDDWSSSSDEHSWEKDPMKEDEPQEVTTATTMPRKLSKSSIQQQQQQQQQKGRGNNASNQIKKCLYCGSKSTPMWRRGPQGAGTLCNACGVKWKHGKILNGNNNTTTEVMDSTIQQQQQRRNSNTKGEKKRKRSNASSNNGTKRVTKKRAASITEPYYAVPAPPPQWEAASSSTTSDSRSPLESFSSSPNTSPSITTLLDGQTDMKRDILMSYDTETLSVYVGEDAVEAAAVLTLLKRS